MQKEKRGELLNQFYNEDGVSGEAGASNCDMACVSARSGSSFLQQEGLFKADQQCRKRDKGGQTWQEAHCMQAPRFREAGEDTSDGKAEMNPFLPVSSLLLCI